MLTLRQLIQKQAAERPDRPFLHFEDETVTYAQLLDRVKRAAAALKDKGVAEGDRVLLMMGSHPEHIYIYLALSCIGAVNIELSVYLKRSGIQLQLEDADPRAVIVDGDYV